MFHVCRIQNVCNLSTVIAQRNWNALALVTKYNGTIHNNCCSSSYCRLPTGLFIQFCGSLNLMVDNDKFNVTRNHLLYLVFVVRWYYFFSRSFHFTFLFFLSVHFLVDLFALCCTLNDRQNADSARPMFRTVQFAMDATRNILSLFLCLSRLTFQMETKKTIETNVRALCELFRTMNNRLNE